MSRRVHSLVQERAKRDFQRLLRLQDQLAQRGFALDALWGDKLIVQRWGLYRVLSLNEAERFLAQLRRSR